MVPSLAVNYRMRVGTLNFIGICWKLGNGIRFFANPVRMHDSLIFNALI